MPMSRFGVMKHLGILERAGLVIARRQGRLRFNHLNAAPLHALQARWLSPRAAALAGAIDRLFGRVGDGRWHRSTRGGRRRRRARMAGRGLGPEGLGRLCSSGLAAGGPPRTARSRRIRRCRRTPRSAPSCARRRKGTGIVWYRVMAIDPLRSVDLIGHLAARYGGPATSMLHIELVPGPRTAPACSSSPIRCSADRPDRSLAERRLAGDRRRRLIRSGRRSGMIVSFWRPRSRRIRSRERPRRGAPVAEQAASSNRGDLEGALASYCPAADQLGRSWRAQPWLSALRRSMREEFGVAGAMGTRPSRPANVAARRGRSSSSSVGRSRWRRALMGGVSGQCGRLPGRPGSFSSTRARPSRSILAFARLASMCAPSRCG